MISKPGVFNFVYVGGPQDGETILQLRHYIWLTSKEWGDHYYRWDYAKEAYVWTEGHPEEPESPTL